MSTRTKRNSKTLQLPPSALRDPSAISDQRPISIPEGQALSSHSRRQQEQIPPDTSMFNQTHEFMMLEELGQGHRGTVLKLQHMLTKKIVVAKIVPVIEMNHRERKVILREVQSMQSYASPNVITSYDAHLGAPTIYLNTNHKKILSHLKQESNICIYMEFMDKRSFAEISRRVGVIPTEIVGKIAVAVLNGLKYLHDNRQIFHRDIKPSNILLNSSGDIKICDFGISGELNSFTGTFAGTSMYMSPERISGSAPSSKSDIWSLGITLLELCIGRFPYDDDGVGESQLDLPWTVDSSEEALDEWESVAPPLDGGRVTTSILELLNRIVDGPAPVVPGFGIGGDGEEFLTACLEKDIEARKTPEELLGHAWVLSSRDNGADVKAWAATI